MISRFSLAALICSMFSTHAFAEESMSAAMEVFYAGQVAEARGDYSTAQELYALVSDQYEDIDAQEMADDALLFLAFSGLEQPTRHTVSDQSFMYLSARAKAVNGLIDPDDTTAIDTADTALDVLLAGTFNLWSQENSALALSGSLLREDYVDFSSFDLQLLGAALKFDRVFGRHFLRVQVGHSDVTLGGDDYLSFSDISFSNTIALGSDWNLRLSGLYRDVASNAAEYDFYAGDSASLGIGLRGRADNRWRLEFSWHTSDVADNEEQFINEAGETLDGFLSYSRDYYSLQGHYEQIWSDRLSQTFSAGIRLTEYQEPNRFLEFFDDSTLTETLRDGTRYSMRTELSWSFSDRLRILGDIGFYDEDSNIDQYDYDSAQFGIGVDYFF